jgi:hypothetical protein
MFIESVRSSMLSRSVPSRSNNTASNFMDIHLRRNDDPLESGAIYQYLTVQARAGKAKASDILETEVYPSAVSLPDSFQHIKGV